MQSVISIHFFQEVDGAILESVEVIAAEFASRLCVVEFPPLLAILPYRRIVAISMAYIILARHHFAEDV